LFLPDYPWLLYYSLEYVNSISRQACHRKGVAFRSAGRHLGDVRDDYHRCSLALKGKLEAAYPTENTDMIVEKKMSKLDSSKRQLNYSE